MFYDLVKAKRNRVEVEEELDDNRLRELMDELFSGSSKEEELDKGRAQFMNPMREELRKEMSDEESDEMSDEMSDETEESDERRVLMDQVYSLIDDLSEEELEQIVNSRAMKKGLAMMLFERAPASDLAEFVSAREAQGEAPSEIQKGHMYKAEELEEPLFEDDV